MTERLRRFGAIVRADVLVRFRRPSTAVLFLLLCWFAYLWIPDPATGRALLQIGGKRALYNSAALGMATASISTIFIGLAGFYILANAIRRDVQSRCGYVIASTTMRAPEYLAGKLGGNIAFLTTFIGAFMVSAMAMQLLRGEAALEPLVFAKQYLLLVPPAIVCVSAFAILFESVPVLRSRLGDVIWFFLWIGLLGAAAANVTATNPGTAGYFDFSGLGFVKASIGTEELAIGSTNFDASKGVHVFEGMRLPAAWVAPRLFATVAPVALLVPALVFFHRFDPARLRKTGVKSHRNWIARLGALAKPFARRAYAMFIRGNGSFASNIRLEAVTSLAASPLSIVLFVFFAITAATNRAPELAKGVMPFAFAAVAVMIADVSTRERRAGTLALVYAAPHIKARYVAWKFLASALMIAFVLAGPIVKIALTATASLTALLVGIAVVASFATAFGVLTSNPKAFIVVFLSLWYAVVSSGGRSPELDFAGFFNASTLPVMAGWLVASAIALAIAHAFHAVTVART